MSRSYDQTRGHQLRLVQRRWITHLETFEDGFQLALGCLADGLGLFDDFFELVRRQAW